MCMLHFVVINSILFNILYVFGPCEGVHVTLCISTVELIF